MLKLFQFVTRRPDQTNAEAIERMQGVHAPWVASAAGQEVLRYSLNVGMPSNYSGWVADEAPAFDAVAEWWVDARDVDSLRHATIDAGLVRTEAEREFAGTTQLMAAEQLLHVDRGRAHQGVKTLFLLTRRPEMTQDQSMAYWHEEHVPLVRDVFGDALVRYATNVGLRADLTGWPDQAPPFDGVAELWLDLTMEEMQAKVAASAHLFLPDERAFIGTYRWLAVAELVHLGADEAPLPAEAPAT